MEAILNPQKGCLMTDRFATNATSANGPATHAFAITPDDANDISEPTRGLYTGTGGDIALVMLSGASLTLTEVTPGIVLPLRVTRVLATGTTATALAGLS
jgi:hypothetical protein